jgi:dTDP-glucose 4,6-dehydratase
MNYLITGGAGFIGNNFIRYLYNKESDAKIKVLDKLTYSSDIQSINELIESNGLKFIKGDICDEEVVNKAMKGIDVIINFAAEVAVDRSIKDQESFLSTDILGVFRLLNEAKKNPQLKKFIQISTDEVYGQIFTGSFSENSETKPRNPYAASKLGGERLAYSFFETYNLPVLITRGSNTYGPRAYLEKVIPLFITNLLDNQHVPIYGNGRQVRDWLYVEDHCSAIYFLINNGIDGEVYNIAGESELTNLQMAYKIINVLGKDLAYIRHVNDRPGHDLRYSISCDKLKNLGWQIEYSFEEGLKKTIQWYIDNEHWWRSVKKNLDPKFIHGYWGDNK